MLVSVHLGLKLHEIYSIPFGMSNVVRLLRSSLGDMLLGFLGYSFFVMARKHNLTVDFLVPGSYSLSAPSSMMFPEHWVQELYCK